MLDIGSAPRILITRLSAIGDCIHTLPLVHALRERFPNAFLAWTTQPPGARILQDVSELDELIVVRRGWYRDFRQVRQVRARLRGLHFDVTIDPQSLTKSSSIAWLSGAKHRIGFSRGQGRELSPWLNTIHVTPTKTHVVRKYLELLRPLGIAGPAVRFNLPISPAADQRMREFLTRQGLPRFALLNPGAGWDSKLWPPENYAVVAQCLARKHGLPSVVMWAGEREHRWAKRIVQLAAGAAHLAPPTSLTELAALCFRARVFVGSDTGPLHLAAAVNTPCVAMYGPTRVDDCGPWGDGHEPLQAFHQAGNGQKRQGCDNRAMRAIAPGAVSAACDRVFARTGEAPARHVA